MLISHRNGIVVMKQGHKLTCEQCRRYGEWQQGACPLTIAFAPIAVYSEYGYVTSRNDKTTGN